MKMIPLVRRIFLYALFFAASGKLLASSAYIGIHSIDGLGRAYAGEVSVAETASATSKNPALILSLKGTQMSVGSAIVFSRFNAQVNKHPFIQENERQDDMEAENFGPNYIPLPGVHLTVNKGNWGYGFSVSSYHGGLLDYSDTDFGILELGDNTYALTANMQLDLAFKVNDKLDIGGGIDYGYGKANVERRFGFVADDRFLNGLSPAVRVVSTLQQNGVTLANDVLPNFMAFSNSDSMLASFRGSASATGFHIGLNYKPSDRLNIGLTYRSKMKYVFEGIYYSDLPRLPLIFAYGTNSERVKGYADVSQPAIAEIGATFKVTPKFHLHGGIFWQQWSDLQALKIAEKFTDKIFVEKDLKHKDNFRYSIGGAYQFTPKFKVRFGLSLDKTAVREKDSSLTFPSSDRYWVSTGFNYKLSKKSSIDFGISYAKNKSVTSREVGLIVQSLNDIPDTLTVNEFLKYLDVKLPQPLGAAGNIVLNVDSLLKPNVYSSDPESETDISVEMLFVGLQYNRTF